MMTPKVKSVTPLDGYRLDVTFATGERKIFDVLPYISGEWFGQLRDINVFRTVHPVGRTVEWADGQDIAPHELYELSKPVKDVCDG